MLPIQDLFPAVARLVRPAELSDGKIQCAWRLAVGASIGRVSRPSLTPDGALVVEVDDPRWQAEIERARPLILERVQLVLGSETARSLVVRISTRVAEPAPAPRRPRDGRMP